MSDVAPQPETRPAPRAYRLGVIHFLLWMAGCAAALTGYRVFTDWSVVPADDLPLLRLTHLGMGMAYGVGVVTLDNHGRRRAGELFVVVGHWSLVIGRNPRSLNSSNMFTPNDQ